MAPHYGKPRAAITERLARAGLSLVFFVFVISPCCVTSTLAYSPTPDEPQLNARRGFSDALLLFAAAIGSVDQTRQLLADGADVSATGPNGETPLILALRNSFFTESLAEDDPLALLLDNSYPGIEQLVQGRFAAIRATTPEYFPMARPAPAHAGYAATVRYLLEHGASAEVRDRTGSSALQYACAFGFEDAVRRMIAAGVAVDGDDAIISPMMLAALFGHEGIVRQLIAAGATVSARSGDAFSPVVLAAMAGYREIVELLLSRNAAALMERRLALYGLVDFWRDRVIEENSVQFAVVGDFLGQGIDAARPDADGVTLLMAASRGRSPALVRLLLDHGGGEMVGQIDGRGWNALIYAAAGRDETGAALIVGELLRAGARVEAIAPDGRTALLAALEAGNEEAAMQLVEAGADPAARQDDGLTPLMIAAHQGMNEIVELLLDRKVDTDSALPNGVAAIHLAAYSGAVDILRLLLEAGAAVDLPTGNGFTPLVVAIRSCPRDNVVEVVRLLLQQGALPDHVLAGDRTPLWYALQRTGLDAVISLLEQYAAVLQPPVVQFSLVEN